MYFLSLLVNGILTQTLIKARVISLLKFKTRMMYSSISFLFVARSLTRTINRFSKIAKNEMHTINMARLRNNLDSILTHFPVALAVQPAALVDSISVLLLAHRADNQIYLTSCLEPSDNVLVAAPVSDKVVAEKTSTQLSRFRSWMHAKAHHEALTLIQSRIVRLAPEPG